MALAPITRVCSDVFGKVEETLLLGVGAISGVASGLIPGSVLGVAPGSAQGQTQASSHIKCLSGSPDLNQPDLNQNRGHSEGLQGRITRSAS